MVTFYATISTMRFSKSPSLSKGSVTRTSHGFIQISTPIQTTVWLICAFERAMCNPSNKNVDTHFVAERLRLRIVPRMRRMGSSTYTCKRAHCVPITEQRLHNATEDGCHRSPAQGCTTAPLGCAQKHSTNWITQYRHSILSNGMF